ncbi:MAG: RNA polymerase sigma factor, partial [Verrucomicrobiales bacterium]
QWSVLVKGNPEAGKFSTRAFIEMSGRYWYPLYVYARRQGLSPEDAQDATQGFFEDLVSGDRLRNVRPEKGRLRAYLLGAMKHFLAGIRRHDGALKRGGGQVMLSIDEELAEQRYQNEPSHAISPEKLFDRGWALAVLQQAIDRLEGEFDARGKKEQFQLVLPQLTGDSERGDHREVAERLGVSESNVRVMVMRARRQFRELLRQLIAETVNGAEELDDELRYLMAALAEPT